MKVLIIGAGPAGCALAHGLRKANIPFSIFDKGESVTRNRHWAFTLGWARPYLLELLPPELGAQLNSCQVDPSIDCAALGQDKIIIYNGQTRDAAFEFPIPNAREINIRKLRTLCVEGLNVHYRKKFTHYEILTSGVRIFFEDGTSEEGDIAVGVDGAMSKMRQCILGDAAAPELLPFALMNFHASYPAEKALFIKEHIHPLIDIAIHPAGHYIRLNVLDMSPESDPSTWTFQILSTWPQKTVEDYDNDTDRVKRLKAHVARDGWAEPYKTAIECITEDTVVLKDQLKIWKPVKWDNQGGRVTLCGDAAHAMTFHRGQGANNALYDSHCFVEAIKSIVNDKVPLEKAIDDYDEKVLKRGMEEVQISKSQTFFTHDWENLVNSPVMKLGTKPSHGAKTEGYK
ncbi:FAD/NAD(P)-binding domain-containing protein [Amniculicola lignicola CBS 123094]|uniref:FAD/NAD(P)-binding domain-containing protein n=1 Tax=Amniculicola lignicola CBS 123094 TaxID=1392246 RepID=A0A6A5WTW0_9PLEO|nr:FAD/NAD(P)-binding domain-containing protein [Amniculicola lignicola CBS 123094]